MQYDFDQIIDRRGTNSVKWEHFPADVLPLWVADTDFAVEPAIIRRIQKRLEHPILGYSIDSVELKETVQQRMERLYNWKIGIESISLVPGIVSGFNFAERAICEAGDNVIFQVPAYPPFFEAPINNNLGSVLNPLVFNKDKNIYEIDFDDFEKKINPRTKMLLLCNPQNPTGRVFTPAELTRLGEICLKHDLIICSDEIHSDIIYNGYRHTPIASLNKELENRSITFIAPSKTFNIPGLSCSVAIIPNPEIHKKYLKALNGFCSGVTCLSQEAGIAAYQEGAEWLSQMKIYLEGNRDFLLNFISREMPSIKTTEIQATFLAWLDCSQTGIPGDPQKFFEENAKVGLNEGIPFGPDYEKFVRLNFGTPRKILKEALERMANSLRQL